MKNECELCGKELINLREKMLVIKDELWKEIQEKANEMYPGFFKPIILRNSRYNQNVSDGACIIEVGATGNTLEQANASMKYLAEVISEVMK